MALFDSIADLFINNSALINQRESAEDYARKRYDPSDLNAVENFYKEVASEGISEGIESQKRLEAIEQLFRDQDLSIYGTNQAAAIAGQRAQNISSTEAYGEFQQELTKQDIKAQRQGLRGAAKTDVKQEQLGSKQEAAIEEAQMQYKAELERRRNKVIGTGLQVLGTAAMAIPGVGPAVSAGISAVTGAASNAIGGNAQQPRVPNQGATKTAQLAPTELVMPDFDLQAFDIEGGNNFEEKYGNNNTPSTGAGNNDSVAALRNLLSNLDSYNTVATGLNY